MNLVVGLVQVLLFQMEIHIVIRLLNSPRLLNPLDLYSRETHLMTRPHQVMGPMLGVILHTVHPNIRQRLQAPLLYQFAATNRILYLQIWPRHHISWVHHRIRILRPTITVGLHHHHTQSENLYNHHCRQILSKVLRRRVLLRRPWLLQNLSYFLDDHHQ
jgi:hypothetical protein